MNSFEGREEDVKSTDVKISIPQIECLKDPFPGKSLLEMIDMRVERVKAGLCRASAKHATYLISIGVVVSSIALCNQIYPALSTLVFWTTLTIRYKR